MTREEIIVAIEAAEHALENAVFVVEANGLCEEIERLNRKLRELDK
jgi:tellurite resistance protein